MPTWVGGEFNRLNTQPYTMSLFSFCSYGSCHSHHWFYPQCLTRQNHGSVWKWGIPVTSPFFGNNMMIHLQLLGYPIVISWNHWWCKYEFPCTIIYVGRNLAISHDCWTEHTLSLSFFWVPGDFFCGLGYHLAEDHSASCYINVQTSHRTDVMNVRTEDV